MTFPTRAYKVLTGPQLAELLGSGGFAGSPIDLLDGYIHLSTEGQLAETLHKHFAGEGDLWIVEVDLIALHDHVRWEPSRGGQLFPHIHAELPVSAVLAHGPLAWSADGKVELPH